MPEGAQPLSLGIQDGIIVMWAMIDPENNAQYAYIHLVGTGEDTDYSPDSFIGTVQEASGFVWHAFWA
jgi:hypothetical protein